MNLLLFQVLLDRTMRYQTFEDSVKEVSRWAMKDYSNLGHLWLKFLGKCSNLPDEVLRVLAQDEDWGVRQAVATMWRQDLPEDVMRVLAKDKIWGVRAGVAQRTQNLPEDISEALAQDEEVKVREQIERRYRDETP